MPHYSAGWQPLYYYIYTGHDHTESLEKRVQRTNYREPIEEQSDECIDYIYSLITK